MATGVNSNKRGIPLVGSSFKVEGLAPGRYFTFRNCPVRGCVVPGLTGDGLCVRTKGSMAAALVREVTGRVVRIL